MPLNSNSVLLPMARPPMSPKQMHHTVRPMTRTRQVPRQEASDRVLPVYDRLFGDRDPVAEPGTATGHPGELVDGLRSDP